MKPIKNIKSKALKINYYWLQSHFNGNVKIHNKYLDAGYPFIGYSLNEEFLIGKYIKVFFEATTEQLSGKAKLQNSIRTVK